ncbi:MAG: PASTA domain-containing protein, partial [Bacteroidia bacterium]|nr:PASTA domain-containing protein [Bacteroidia bacterium]
MAGRKFTKNEDFLRDIYITKGTPIDLLIGDGIGEKQFPIPDLVNLPLDEAEFVIKGHDLVIGNKTYVYNSNQEIGTVIRQSPAVFIGKLKDGIQSGSLQDNRVRNKIRAGEVIDLWISGNPAADPMAEEEELDEEEKRRRDSLETPQNYYDRERLENVIKK